MATLRNKKKLAAVSRETPENTRNRQSQNTLDAKMAQDYISQVSEEIEARVIKKLPIEFSRTESRILGALSKLDEFHLNPQVRTCSVSVPGTSRNNDSEKLLSVDSKQCLVSLHLHSARIVVKIECYDYVLWNAL